MNTHSSASADQIGTTVSADMATVRFQALDSLRGIAAVMVVLFHAQIVSNMRNLEIVRAGELLVDFFFVLSGFVIAHAYMNRISDGRGVGEFLFLRFGRLYPVHLFMIGLFVAFELAKSSVPGLVNAADPAFTGTNEPAFLISNLFLLQDVWPRGTLTWNTPSWSISAEYVTYAVFALAVLFLRPRMVWAAAVAVIAAPILIVLFADDGMETTYQLGLLRALFGFAAGVVLSLLARQWIGERRAAVSAANGEAALKWTIAELAALDVMLLLLSHARGTPFTYVAPFVFAGVVAVFAVEGGHLSRLLRTRFLLLLGALSYTIYMTHMFVLLRVTNVARASDKFFDTSFLQHVGHTDRYGDGIDTGSLLGGDLLMVAVVAAVVAFSYLVYRFVEVPGRDAFRRMSPRIFGSRSAATA